MDNKETIPTSKLIKIDKALAMPDQINHQFFWDFKRMDNVNYNFKIVELLYAEKKKTGINA